MFKAMDHDSMTITLSPHGADLLRAAQDRYPEMSVTELVEEALTERFAKDNPQQFRLRTTDEIRAWLDELASLSDKIPPRPGETFSRETIYQDPDR
jgi:hypothetical protein